MRTREHGSAAAEFALGAGLLALVTGLALVVGLLVLARTSAARCASDGARAGALRPGTAGPDAVAATRACLATATPGGRAATVTADVEAAGPARLVHVVVDVPVPRPFGGAARVHGHAALDDR